MKIKRNKKKVLIPFNSMSDIAFLLLIFIMIVALVNYRKEVKIEYPSAKHALKSNSEKNLEVWINREGAIFLDGEASDSYELENKIAQLYISAPETRVHIIADRSTSYKNIDSVLEILQFLQYRVVSFVVKNDE